MYKLIFILFLTVNSFIYSFSIADFTVQYKNGLFYNFYDNPAQLFNVIEEKNTLSEIQTGSAKDYNFKNCSFSVLSREFGNGTIMFTPGTLNELIELYGMCDANLYYNIDYFEAYKDFSTIRGVSIGDNIKKVLIKYPEAVLYKNNGKYKWEVSDCYHESKITKTKDFSEIGYVLLETANWQYNRSFQTNSILHYELVFVIKDCKVKSIVMQYVIDAM